MLGPVPPVNRAAVEGVERRAAEQLLDLRRDGLGLLPLVAHRVQPTGPSGMSVLAGISSRPGTSVPGRISCIAARTIVGADR